MRATQPAVPPALLMTIGALTFVDFLQNGMVTFAAAPIMGEIGAVSYTHLTLPTTPYV